MTDYRLVIIGAGLAGLTAAVDVVNDPGWAGEQLAIVERDAQVGGRLATEELGGAVFDHGAQFFTVRSPAFGHHVERWRQAGVVEQWCQGFAVEDGYPRYRVAGGMQSLAVHLAAGLRSMGVSISTGAEAAIGATDSDWLVTTPDRTVSTTSILLTPPVPTSRAMLAAGGIALDPVARAALSDFECHRVLALLANLDRPSGLPAPGALQQPDHPVFSFVADNQAKGISPQPCVTFHTAHALSAELWDRTDNEILSELRAAAEETVAPATITDLQIRRWPCSGPVTPHPDPYLLAATEPGPLVLAGDGFGGSKVEGAFSSGLAAATMIRNGVG